MRTKDTITVLKIDAAAIKQFGATSLYMYGSAARDELRPDSDVDLFVDYDRSEAGTFSLIDLIRLQSHLEKVLGRDVDLATRQGLHPLLRESIEQSSIRIF